MVLTYLQTLEFEALIAEEKCLVELHAALPLTLRSTEETVTIDKWLCFTQLLLLIEIAGEPAKTPPPKPRHPLLIPLYPHLSEGYNALRGRVYRRRER